MRLEKLCTLRMQYREGTWLAPYGENEYAGSGPGRATSLARGFAGRCTGRIIRDGAKILISIKGYSIIEETPTVNRAIVAAVWFQTDDARSGG